VLLHKIGQWDGPGIHNRWIGKYIFLGAYCPSALPFDAFAIPGSAGHALRTRQRTGPQRSAGHNATMIYVIRFNGCRAASANFSHSTAISR